jgi:hypothetical protein
LSTTKDLGKNRDVQQRPTDPNNPKACCFLPEKDFYRRRKHLHHSLRSANRTPSWARFLNFTLTVRRQRPAMLIRVPIRTPATA